MNQVTWFDVIGFGAWIIPCNLILIPMIIAFFVWNPKYFVMLYSRIRTWYFGFSKKEIQCNDLSISYIERGHLSVVAPSILFVHGYSSQKENWIDLIRNLPQQMHVIALDLPGHGESEYKNEKLSLEFYTQIVKKFVDGFGLNKRKFHLVGQSMGGCITGMYASHYPDDLLSAGLFCPHGIKHNLTLQESKTFKETGGSHLLPTNMETFEHMLSVLTYKPIPIPAIVKRGMLQLRLENDRFYRKLMECLIHDMDTLNQLLHKIKTPTFVLWGKQDKILDVECVEMMKKKLEPKNLKLIVLDNVGHALSVEEPKKSAEVILEFIHSL